MHILVCIQGLRNLSPSLVHSMQEALVLHWRRFRYGPEFVPGEALESIMVELADRQAALRAAGCHRNSKAATSAINGQAAGKTSIENEQVARLIDTSSSNIRREFSKLVTPQNMRFRPWTLSASGLSPPTDAL